MAPPPVPDRSRDNGWSQQTSSDPRSTSVSRNNRPKSTGSGWDALTTSVWSKVSDSGILDTAGKSPKSAGSSSGWGPPEQALGWGDAGASDGWDDAGGWGTPFDTTSAVGRSLAEIEGTSVANTKVLGIPDSVSDFDSWYAPDDSGVLDQAVPTITPGASASTLPVHDVSSAATSTILFDQSRSDKGWGGMAEKIARQNEPRKGSLPGHSSSALPPTGTAPTQNLPARLPFSSDSRPLPLDKPLSNQSSTDAVSEDIWGTTPVGSPRDSASSNLDKAGNEVLKAMASVISSSNPAAPRSSNSTTPKPTLTIFMPNSPNSAGQRTALSLLLQSPFASLLSSGTTRGPSVARSTVQQAWGGRIDMLSHAVAAQMERVRFNETVYDRQRLISRINRKAGRSNFVSVSNVPEEVKSKEIEDKVQIARAQLLERKDGEQHWWPTPRAGIDYEETISSLENDVKRLQQLLGEQNAKNDGMEVDVQDEANPKMLLKRRKSMFLDVKELLEYITERLERAEGVVDDQKQSLNDQASRILGEAYPPSTAPGADGHAKLEELRERFEELETRMSAHLLDLNRRIQLDKLRIRDMQELKTRYKELVQKKIDLAARKKKLTDESRDFLASTMARPTLAEQVLKRTMSGEARERIIRMMVPKLQSGAESYRAEDLAWATQRQAIIDTAFEAWKSTRGQERKQREEALLQALESDQALKAVDIAGREIERRWSEVVSVQRITRKSPAIRIPADSGPSLGLS